MTAFVLTASIAAASASGLVSAVNDIVAPVISNNIKEKKQLCMNAHSNMGFATVKNNKVIGIQPMSEKSPLARFRIFSVIAPDHRANPIQGWEHKDSSKYSTGGVSEPASIRDERIMKSIQFLLDSEEFKALNINCSFSGMPPTISDVQNLNYKQSSYMKELLSR